MQRKRTRTGKNFIKQRCLQRQKKLQIGANFEIGKIIQKKMIYANEIDRIIKEIRRDLKLARKKEQVIMTYTKINEVPFIFSEV